MGGNSIGFDPSHVKANNFSATSANYTNNDVGNDDDLIKKSKKDANGMSPDFQYNNNVFNNPRVGFAKHGSGASAVGGGYYG